MICPFCQNKIVDYCKGDNHILDIFGNGYRIKLPKYNLIIDAWDSTSIQNGVIFRDANKIPSILVNDSFIYKMNYVPLFQINPLIQKFLNIRAFL